MARLLALALAAVLIASAAKPGDVKQLQTNISIDLEGVKGLLKGLGTEAAGANPTSFVDTSLLQELEREGFFQTKSRCQR